MGPFAFMPGWKAATLLIESRSVAVARLHIVGLRSRSQREERASAKWAREEAWASGFTRLFSFVS